jgi:hypothetical protein
MSDFSSGFALMILMASAFNSAKFMLFLLSYTANILKSFDIKKSQAKKITWDANFFKKVL